LAQLDAATFDRLHHDVRGIGIVCHDLKTVVRSISRPAPIVVFG
jgi:hypothetical protein